MTAHVHAEDKYHEVLRLWWCTCGAERRAGGVWTPPRTTEGFVRRARSWKKEETSQ